MRLLFRAFFSLWRRGNQGAQFGLLTLLVAALLVACDDGTQSEKPTQPAQALKSTATPTPTPQPTATPTPTPQPTATPTPTPQPTAIPTPTPQPQPQPIATPTPQPPAGADDLDGCADVLTRAHSLRDLLTNEDLIQCLSEELQTGTLGPTTTPTETPPPAVGGCEDVLTREHSLRDLLTNEDLIRCLREELQ